MAAIPLELLLSDELQRLLDDFSALLDIRVTFFSTSGKFLRRGKAMCNCDYCRMIQNDPEGKKRCISMDADKRSEALERREIIDYRCHAGLRECIAPVWAQDVPAGFIMFGQFRLDGDKMPEFPNSAPEQKQKMQAAFDSLPCFSEEKLKSILGVLRTLIDYITVREFAVFQSDHLRTDIDNYIRKHATEDIRLPDMAKKIGKSVSTISQFLRRNYHTSFKGLLLDARLAIAEKHWRDNPHATVAEVAFASGFRDQFYFSRVFRRRRGIPPGKFRNQMRPAAQTADFPGLSAE